MYKTFKFNTTWEEKLQDYPGKRPADPHANWSSQVAGGVPEDSIEVVVCIIHVRCDVI